MKRLTTGPVTTTLLAATACAGIAGRRTSALRRATARTRATAAAQIAAHPNQPTVTVGIWGGGTVTVHEPDWCTGHQTSGIGDHPEDITHSSAEQFLQLTLPSGDTTTMLSAWITSSPFDTPSPRAVVSLPDGDCQDYDAAQLDQLATDLHAAAAHIEKLRNQLIAARAVQ